MKTIVGGCVVLLCACGSSREQECDPTGSYSIAFQELEEGVGAIDRCGPIAPSSVDLLPGGTIWGSCDFLVDGCEDSSLWSEEGCFVETLTYCQAGSYRAGLMGSITWAASGSVGTGELDQAVVAGDSHWQCWSTYRVELSRVSP
jgi:hypothetical protein